MTTQNLWTSQAGALALVALLCGTLRGAEQRDQEWPGYRAHSTTTQQRTTGSLQQPSVTITIPGVAQPSQSPATGSPDQPGGAAQLPGLPAGPARSAGGATPPSPPTVTSAINPTQPRPSPPTVGIPLVPTPTTAPTGYGYPPAAQTFPTPPTAYRALGGPPAAPTAAPPISSGLPALPASGTPSPGYAPAAINPGVAPSPTAISQKPFSGYSPPPTYSPYMNLFRTDNDRGRVNNYYSLVRPAVDQQRVNYQTQNSLQSLQTTTRVQGSQLEQLNQRTQPPRPAANPSFMNYQNYYPGLSR
jgi:hypothetical protein